MGGTQLNMFSVCIFLYITECEWGYVTSSVFIYLGKCRNNEEFNYLTLTDEFEENARQTGWIVGL
jgi:hypothetical protein